jgi:hypothetical protein
MNGLGASGSDPNDAWFRSRQQWHQVVVDPNGGWFGSEFSLDGAGPGQAAASGITYCQSADTGRQWACRGSIDSVFDGATEFNGSAGWVGGGEISPDVAGWLHRTRDGGQTWSGRVLTTAWPIRQIESLGPRLVWAAGGNIYSGAGGIDVSTDGGRTWTQDLDTGTEVGACSHHAIGTGAKTRVWCVGDAYDGSQFSSVVYATTVATPAS